MTPLFSGAVLVAWGRSTCAADSIVTEVVTMKMMSRTRKISVSGVMLMLSKTPPPVDVCGPLIATRLSPCDCGVDQALVVDVLHRADVLNLDRKIVVEDNRNDRDRESKCRRDQRFRNTGCDDRETAGAHDRHRLECDQDSDDGAEQPDERGGGAGGREHPDVALEFEAFLVATLVVELKQVIAIQGLRARDEGMVDALRGGAARLRRLQRFVELALAELRDQRVGQLRGPRCDTPERPHPFKNYREAHDRNEQQRIGCIVALLNHPQNSKI